MKIPKIINNRYTRQILLFPTLAIPIALVSKSCEENIVNNIQQEVLAKDSLRYARVMNETRNKNIFDKKIVWLKEKALMEDSLQLDSNYINNVSK